MNTTAPVHQYITDRTAEFALSRYNKARQHVKLPMNPIIIASNPDTVATSYCNMASVLYPPTSHMCSRTQMVTYTESIMTMFQESCLSHIKDSVKHMYIETIRTKDTVLPLGPLFVLPPSRLDLIQHERLLASIRCRPPRPRPQRTNQ